jgi:hypothetical protein
MLRYNWIIPNKLYQADDGSGEGGGENHDQDPDDDQITPETKLSELDTDQLDELMDREDVDIDKYLEWMKTQDEDQTFDTILIKEDPDKKDDDDDTETDDDPDKDKKDTDDDDGVDDADPEKDGDQTKADDKKDDDQKLEDGSNGKADDQSAADDKTKAKTIKISDEYITKQVQSFREQMKDDDPELTNKKAEQFQDILNGIKGGEMDGKALKNYVNAQMYIKTIKSPFDADWKPEQKVVSDPEYIKKATEQKQKMILDRVRKQFPDYPEDAEDDEAVKDFEEGLSRRDFQNYSEQVKNIESEIDADYDRYIHVVTNWEDIAKDTITADVKLFEARISKLNLSLKDLGIESLDLNEKDLYNEYLWKNVLFKDGETNKPDGNVLTYMDETIPIVKPGSVYGKLIDLNLELILGSKEHAARKQGFDAGLNNQEDPSTSDAPGKEHRDKIEIDEEDFTDDTTPEQDQEKLDALKKTISAASGAKVKKRK